MQEVLPFELLQSIAEQLGFNHDPVTVGEKRYRPIVFKVNKTNHYVFCLTPLFIEPQDFFDGVGDAYNKYLDGKDADGYMFFRDMNPDQLKTRVVNWYSTLVDL